MHTRNKIEMALCCFVSLQRKRQQFETCDRVPIFIVHVFDNVPRVLGKEKKKKTKNLQMVSEGIEPGSWESSEHNYNHYALSLYFCFFIFAN